MKNIMGNDKWLHLLLILSSCTWTISGKILRWNKNTNYMTASNWDKGLVPCANQRVVFPAASPIIYVQNSLAASEIVLPNDGQLIFADGASISFPTQNLDDTSCPPEDVHYIGGERGNSSWFDPGNWCEVGQTGGGCLDPQPSRLDLERVPCSTDSVVFPSDTSFIVDLEHSINIHVGSLIIANQDYTTQAIRNYTRTEMGRKMFLFSSGAGSTPTTVTVEGILCKDENLGCDCKNSMDNALKEKICSKQKCAEVKCESPLTPASHCCPVCGAIVMVEYGTLTRLKPLENLANRILNQQAVGSGIRTISSRLPDGEHIQIVVVDDGSDKAMGVGQEIKNQIEKDMKEKNKYNVNDVSVKFSGYTNPTPEPHKGDEGGHVGTANIVVIVLALILLLAILAVTIYCTSRHRRPIKDLVPRVPAVIQRVLDERKAKRTVELELARTVTFNNNVIFESSGGFDNPNFGQGPDILDATQGRGYVPGEGSGVEELQPGYGYSKGSFENPMYGESPVEGQIHAAILHKTPIDDDVISATPTRDFPKKTKEGGVKGGAKAVIEKLRPSKHQKMEEERKSGDESSDSSIQEQKQERAKPFSGISTKEKKSKSGRAEDKEEIIPAEEEGESERKERKLKLQVLPRSGMREKLVESSEEEPEVEMDLGELKQEQDGGKQEEKKGKKKKKKSKESKGGFGNPVYALEEEERRKKRAEEAEKRVSESQATESKLIELEGEEPGESEA